MVKYSLIQIELLRAEPEVTPKGSGYISLAPKNLSCSFPSVLPSYTSTLEPPAISPLYYCLTLAP